MKNPLLWLELRIRIRERKLWVVSFLYLLCLLGMSFVPLLSTIDQPYAAPSQPADIGIAIFSTSIFTLLALLLIISPLSSAGAISQEREQRTLPGLLNTPLSSARIAFGKLLATWVFILWLIALSCPFLFLGMIWCGIAWWEVLTALGIIFAAGMLTSTVALGLSGYFKRTITSYLGTGTIFFLWFVVWPIIGGLTSSLEPQNDKAAQDRFLIFQFYTFWAHHPVAPLILAFQKELFEGSSPSPINATTALFFALFIWLVVGIIFFLIACRGIRRALTDK
jgi:ABC-type transport system involved in multi-copper enzyme maturation permease subunit